MRPRFEEQQRLSALDLQTEQAHRNERRRHGIAQHIWGIVNGLTLSIDQNGLTVTPGCAIDGYGRELILTYHAHIPMDELQQIDPRTADIWLGYALEKECLSDGSERWIEDPMVMVSNTAVNLDGRRPSDVDEEDWDFAPYRALPRDAQALFPVYLGRVDFETPIPETAKTPYAGLIGAEVTSPDGCTRLSLNDALGTRRSFGLRFNNQPDILQIRSDETTAEINIRGNLTLQGASDNNNLTPDTGTYRRHQVQGVQYASGISVPDQAKPWQIYRALFDKDPNRQTLETPSAEQLRFEIYNPGDQGKPASQSLVMGYWSQGHFLPCITVSADCSVTLSPCSTLKMHGEIIEMPVLPDISDPRYAEAILKVWKEGLTFAAKSVYPAEFSGLRLGLRLLSNEFKVGQEIRYQVELHNSGSTTIQNITLREIVIIPGEAEPGIEIKPINELQPGERIPNFQARLDANKPGKLVIVVEVEGSVPGGRRISDTQVITQEITADNPG